MKLYTGGCPDLPASAERSCPAGVGCAMHPQCAARKLRAVMETPPPIYGVRPVNPAAGWLTIGEALMRYRK